MDVNAKRDQNSVESFALITASLFALFIGIAWIQFAIIVTSRYPEYRVILSVFQDHAWFQWLLIVVVAVFAGLFIHHYRITVHFWMEAQWQRQESGLFAWYALKSSLLFFMCYLIPLGMTSLLIQNTLHLFIYGGIILLIWIILIAGQSGDFIIKWKPKRKWGLAYE